MSSVSLETQSRVQCIKQKFEGSISERNKIVSSKSVHTGPVVHRDLNPGSLLFPFRTGTDFGKTDANRADGGKALVKRTPAFRREKFGCIKTLGKVHCTQSEEHVNDFILNERMRSNSDKELKVDAIIAKLEPLSDTNKFENIQRSKTDLLVNLCDNKNFSKANYTKSTLISRRINILGENENTQSKDCLSYAVVDKSQKKKFNEKKKEKDTELKLSESLRKALQSPLPKGPPPKKPPRTFCHVMSSGHCQSQPTGSNSIGNTCKDLPKLKSKLEKLESIIKNHDKKSNIPRCVPGDDFKADLEEKMKRVQKLSESKSLPSALKKRNENKNCLQLTSCMNPCTDVVFDEKLFDDSQSSLTNVYEAESSTQCTKVTTDEVSPTTKCSTGEAAVRRTMSEPIYDLPYVTAKNVSDNKSKQSNELNQPNSHKAEEGLHYLCTDVVNKLSRVKPVEFSPAENWTHSLGSHLTRGCDGLKENTQTTTTTTAARDGRRDPGIEEKEEEDGEGSPAGTGSLPADDGKGMQPDVKSIKSDSDSWSMGSESEREWTPGSDLWSQDLNEATKSSIKKEILFRKTAQRKDYVSKVSAKLFNCVPYWMSLKGNISSHLFECCLLVGLTLENDKNVPYIKNIYPPNVKPPPLIEALCFPDASNWPPNTGNEPEEQYYSLVVTNENGERKFGYCRRVLPEGGNLCLPLTYCIITPHRANGFFYKVLEELESRHGSMDMENFIRQLYEAQFPGPGEVLKLKKILEEATKTSFAPKDSCLASTLVRRPCDVRLEEKNLTQLFQYLQLSVFIKIFSSLLHERKVLLLSNSLRKLSSCIEALQSTLLPFSWQHTYIPVLPVHLLETCEAPTPYVIGLPKSKNVEHSLENIVFENGIMVDLDECRILKCCGDEGTILPHRLIKSLKTSLNLAVNAMLPETNRNVLISDAFISFFVQVCGHYSKFIAVSDGEKIFQQKEFVKYVTSTTTQSFLDWFSKTAMFQAFIHERLHGIPEDIPVKLFSLRATENPTETMKNSMVLPLNYKGINKKVKSFSDKIKDFIQ